MACAAPRQLWPERTRHRAQSLQRLCVSSLCAGPPCSVRMVLGGRREAGGGWLCPKPPSPHPALLPGGGQESRCPRPHAANAQPARSLLGSSSQWPPAALRTQPTSPAVPTGPLPSSGLGGPLSGLALALQTWVRGPRRGSPLPLRRRLEMDTEAQRSLPPQEGLWPSPVTMPALPCHGWSREGPGTCLDRHLPASHTTEHHCVMVVTRGHEQRGQSPSSTPLSRCG